MSGDANIKEFQDLQSAAQQCVLCVVSGCTLMSRGNKHEVVMVNGAAG